jgi:glutamate synthase domain-containing protein 2/glutamate synthase domain-containing protein 1/glutamate synthase domain-containing protein 3
MQVLVRKEPPVDNQQTPFGRALPPRIGLYDPAFERDACGTGFIARRSGEASYEVLRLGLEALQNLAHRGAVGADAHSGDGAGVLTQLPAFLAPAGHAVAMGFWPADPADRARVQALAEAAIGCAGLVVAGWRVVPVRPEVLGERARSAMPHVAQLIVGPGVRSSDFELACFEARKRIERAVGGDAYVCSFSPRTIVYKALASGHQLKAFYPDLEDPRFETAICVFHQRYSTNTFPSWPLAQPFRLVGHNGEINTLAGNLNAVAAREHAPGGRWQQADLAWLRPFVQPGGSDSSALDNVLELLAASGRDVLAALRVLVPAADPAPAMAAFYEHHAAGQEPWDGPAALVVTDGVVVGAGLDRNGLRPARYVVTGDGLVVLGSEAGLVELAGARVVQQGRLGPGRMLAVDTRTGELLHDEALGLRMATAHPFGEWVAARTLEGGRAAAAPLPDPAALARLQLLHGYTREDVTQVIGAMASTGKEPIGSMGDDTPLAALSVKGRPLHHYFRQRFAQVTNPPIDPLREKLVMSLRTHLGARDAWLGEGAGAARLIALASPVLADAELAWLRGPEAAAHLGPPVELAMAWEPDEGLATALAALGRAAVAAAGALLILTDRGVAAPLPSLLALAAVERALADAGQLMAKSIVIEAGDVREDHHVALLIGHGAAAVNPYLAFATAAVMDLPDGAANVKAALELGLTKILAKMGICTVASYRGARIFEAIGLGPALVATYFPKTTARLGGAELETFARELADRHALARADEAVLQDLGLYRFRVGGEYHQYAPQVFKAIHAVGKTGKPEDFKTLAQLVENRPNAALRDLLTFRGGEAVPLEEVEPATAIVRRFVASAMSLGALSPEAHAAVAVAMARLGARSNSGEGGEDPARYVTEANSTIKQVAAGRFGVTPGYLASARELEIKMAQGAKPGEGGQLPGPKVTVEIAKLRYATPGVPLISPPPHHDIYSIEDLAQLIHDLREVNPRAAIAVKLVSEAGVGTVAAGVVKAHADVVHVSGHDGGTGASPLGSIKYAGSPWELGLAETQQVLVRNGLRGRVRVRVDGGLKSGRDVLVAALLGADEYGFGTALVVAAGCVMARQCHQNNCPVGIATQVPELRARFKGTPEQIMNYLLGLAEDVRGLLAGLGLRSLDEAIGRVDLLVPTQAASLDLSPMLVDAGAPRRFEGGVERTFAEMPDDQALRALDHGFFGLAARLRNTQRSVGARLAGAIAARHGDHGFQGSVSLAFHGVAGQSFGAFCLDGMALELTGLANDYVGKAMAGGVIVVKPETRGDAVLVGNTVLYGATGGALYVAGAAGERFAVRNSGARAVVEGVGDHGCEYMTRGHVVVIGPTGRNFGAGMTGGAAFVLDEDGGFVARTNPETIKLERPGGEDQARIRTLLEEHLEHTASPRAAAILADWPAYAARFWVVMGAVEAAKVTSLPERRSQGLPRAL